MHAGVQIIDIQMRDVVHVESALRRRLCVGQQTSVGTESRGTVFTCEGCHLFDFVGGKVHDEDIAVLIKVRIRCDVADKCDILSVSADHGTCFIGISLGEGIRLFGFEMKANVGNTKYLYSVLRCVLPNCLGWLLLNNRLGHFCRKLA